MDKTTKLQDLIDRCTNIIDKDLEKIEKYADTGTLDEKQGKLVTEYVKTLAVIQKYQNEFDNEEDFNKMSYEDIVAKAKTIINNKK